MWKIGMAAVGPDIPQRPQKFRSLVGSPNDGPRLIPPSGEAAGCRSTRHPAGDRSSEHRDPTSGILSGRCAALPSFLLPRDVGRRTSSTDRLRQALFAILDHSVRRNADQDRVIGTLLGVRSEDGGEVEIRNAFAVPHTEILNEQVEVEMEYQKSMLSLHLRANPREVLVGWYATSSELNQFSALIQNFYGSQPDGTYPHPAVHLTVSTVPGEDIQTRAYVSAPVGVTTERIQDSASFIPVPHEVRYGDAEKSGLELITAAKDREDRTAGAITDVESLERALEEVLALIDRVSDYVDSVIDEERPPSTGLGQFLLDALALAPKVDPADIERDL